ncbi:hypothetical protein GV792_16495 [Nocardia cyriacigeorgica]|uniref:hypothetical protein n=1 Tax=Nocardia cyriacigeorgica TaxID=135487 RepID=UPI0013BC4F24|nr:hypothetical protein [Nocardia cyriacigeorgica]NEW40033.1 hypothetical protein [Nocardia cyriacigeorgica]NEW51641.1 hypothetical protein [Nocardia cyriacigeorgica]
MTPPTDEPTRYLAAAVHLDDELADALVEEYLAEPKRAIPPSPGVDAATVLREALAAQSRRRTVNTALLGLLAITTVLAFPLVAVWLASGLTWRVCSTIVSRLTYSSSGSGRFFLGRRQRWWATAVIWWLLAFLWLLLPAMVAVPFGAFLIGSSDSGSSSGIAVLLVLTALALTTAMLCVLIARHYLPWQVATNWFGYGRYHSQTAPREAVVKASAPYAARLQRITQDQLRRSQENSGEIVVYRGRKPFVGAGNRVRSWSAALELYAKTTTEDAAAPEKTVALVPSFDPRELQDFVSEDLKKLRTSPTLTPGWRFSDLGITSWALLSPVDIVHNPSAGPLLDRLNAGAEPELNEQDWADLANKSPEWLRYYRCFRLESWARQLAVSGFLHVGCEERILVLEWHAFVLPPIAPTFRRVDTPPDMLELRALWAAVADLALLPTTVPSRVGDLVRGIIARNRPGGTWTTPDEAARVLGAAASIREIGAGNRLNNLFQETDCDRYVKILERRTLDAAHRYLTEKGIAAKGFDDMVKQINNSTIVNNSNVIAGNIGGEGNSGSVQSGPENNSTATE